MSARSRTRRPGARRRRRAFVGLVVAGVAALAAIAVIPLFDKAVRELTLPLRHEDIIRQQAADKRLDPALIAAVIYAESKFRGDRTSPAGARGLMQITPDTARYIARRSGATNFRVDDLGTPQVNISYGSFYLRYLLDRYGDNDVLAVAAYNAGEGNVDRWIAEASVNDRAFKVSQIPFAETRTYVNRVVEARAQYREEYPKELGL